MSLSGLDTSLFFLINNGLQNTVLDVLMPFVTDNAKLLFLPLVVWFFLKEKGKTWPILIMAVVAVGFADGGGNVLKHLFERVRPCNALEQVHLLTGCGGSFSLPSNHASNAFGFAMVFWFSRRNAPTSLLVFAASLVAFSRIYVGVHYPFDVVAGALLGAVAAYGTISLYKWAGRIYRTASYEQALYFALLLFSLFRIYYILTGPFDLSTDEAHYWEWSRRLDLSYYSKGPMIAYLVYLGTALFGDNVFGVRILAVVLSALSSILLFRLGRELYDERTGLVSALLVQIVPLYSIFGILFSIDSPFMFFWILSLFLFWRALDFSGAAGMRKPSQLNWVLLGLSVGLGLLAKYTMAFFPLSCLLFMVFHRESRRFLAGRGPYLALITSAIVFSPVVFWNAGNGWVTLKHTAGQAHLAAGLTISARYFFDFIGSQMGVVTPLLAVMICIALWRLKKSREGAFLFWFAVPIILFFLLKSVQGKVQGNWALTGYATGFIAFSAYYVRGIELSRRSTRVLVAAAISLAFAVTVIAHLPSVPGLSPEVNPSKKLMGWKELAKEVDGRYSVMASGGPVFVFSDSYQIASELAFYMEGNPVTYCVNLGRRMNQYDLWPGFEKLVGSNALLVMYDEQEMPADLAAAFAKFERETVSLRMKTGRTVKFTVFKCYDFKGIKTRQAETY